MLQALTAEEAQPSFPTHWCRGAQGVKGVQGRDPGERNQKGHPFGCPFLNAASWREAEDWSYSLTVHSLMLPYHTVKGRSSKPWTRVLTP